MSKILKRVASVAAPIAGNFLLPGLGGVLGGAIGGGLSGGGLKGILSGGLGGAALGYGGAFGSALGAGSGAAGNALGSGLLGAAAGGISGGAKGALLGGAAGGLGGYAQSGGFDGLGDTALGRGVNSLYSDATGGLNDASNYLGGGKLFDGSGQIFGSGNSLTGNSSAFGTPGAVADAPAIGGGGSSSLGGNLQDDGTILGKNFSLSGSTPGGVSTPTAGGKVPSFDLSSKLGSILSAGIGTNANDAARKAQLAAQQQALAQITPFQNRTFTPGDLTQDPGYQFQLKQGQDALAARQAATGNFYSGGAAKELTDYSQGLADTTYGNAYNRFLQGNAQQFGAAQSAAGLYSGIGDVNAHAGINDANLLSRGLSGVLGGGGFNNNGQSYDDNNILAQLLKGYGNYGRS